MYHYALVHKLKCAQYHLDKIISLVSNPPADFLESRSDFLFLTNMYLDGFFHSCGSAMDILAREVLIYFDLPLPVDVYFGMAKSVLSARRPGDTIINRLENPSWRDEFSRYRNALTHENIVVKNYEIDVIEDGNIQNIKIMIKLPDDPRVDVSARTFRRNPDGVGYCKRQLKRLLQLIHPIYTDIATRAETSGSLPL